jgi:hypothetical protein
MYLHINYVLYMYPNPSMTKTPKYRAADNTFLRSEKCQ